jgi:cytochrome c oxidase subunit 2
LKAPSFSLFAIAVSAAHADWGALNMTEGVTILSKKIYALHQLILWICVAIASWYSAR